MPDTTRLHLCQPDVLKSCGACCGLYNWENHSRPAVQSLLERRTELFASVVSDGDLDSYRRMAGMFNPGPKLCETIYNCEFLGFVDGHTVLALTTVGLAGYNLYIGITKLRNGTGMGAMIASVSSHRRPGRLMVGSFTGTMASAYLIYLLLYARA